MPADRLPSDPVRAGWTALVWDMDGTLTVPGEPVAAPGLSEVLAAWAARGTPMAVATSASTAVARAVLAELGYDGWFGHVAGSAPGVFGKEAVVAEALLGLGRPLPEGAAGAVMIGDTPADVQAAHALGLLAVGVGWGAVPAEVLVAAGADHVVDDPARLAPP